MKKREKREKRGESCISNTNRKTGMPTSNPLVQIPLSLLAITSAQGLSIWCMQEAVVIQWRFSMKQRQYYSNYNSMQKTPELSIALCATCSSSGLLQITGVPHNTHLRLLTLHRLLLREAVHPKTYPGLSN